MRIMIIDDHLNRKTERRRTVGSMESKVSQTEDQNVSRVSPEHNTALLLQIEELGKIFLTPLSLIRDKHRSENPPGESRQTLSWSTHFDAPRLPDDQDVIWWFWHWYRCVSISIPLHCPRGDLMVTYRSHQKEYQIACINEQTSWCKFWNKFCHHDQHKIVMKKTINKETDYQKWYSTKNNWQDQQKKPHHGTWRWVVWLIINGYLH